MNCNELILYIAIWNSVENTCRRALNFFHFMENCFLLSSNAAKTKGSAKSSKYAIEKI